MSCVRLLSVHICRIVRDLCVCSVGPMINQARDVAEMLAAGIIADTPCGTVASDRKRLQASGIERGRSMCVEILVFSAIVILWSSCR